MRVDLNSNTVTVNGETREGQPTSIELLFILSDGEPHEIAEVKRKLWGVLMPDDKALRNYVFNARSLIKGWPFELVTIGKRGHATIGYQLEEQDDWQEYPATSSEELASLAWYQGYAGVLGDAKREEQRPTRSA